MKTVAALVLGLAASARASPVTKVLELLSGLETKITAEGVTAEKSYEEFSAWCEDTSKNLNFDIKTGKAKSEDLKAAIEQETARATSLSAKIDDLAGSLSADDADLKSATEIRATEASDFSASEKELVEVTGTLERAITILEREAAKGSASMLQTQNVNGLAGALTAMVQASMLSSADAGRLTALVQSSQQSDDSSDDVGAPAAAVYESHSSNIVDTLEDLLDKAQAQLADARKQETEALHNFEMLKQSLEDQIKFANKDMSAAKKDIAASGEAKATAESDLAITSKGVKEDSKALADLTSNCMTKSEDFEAEKKSRAEELKALAAAKQVIAEATGGAADLSYGLVQTSFLQVNSKINSGADLANFEAVRFVRDLARKQHSTALAQLASRMAAAMRQSSSNGDDPFAKVKGLISGMIEKLEGEMSADASHKAYCDKETSESVEKKAEKSAVEDKLTTKIDQMSAKSAQLKEQTAALQKSLAELASSQAEMTKMRSDEKAAFTTNKAEMEQGLEGVKMALKILREYYSAEGKAHEEGGEATGIVGLIEVVESDFSKGLAEMVTTEDSAAASYDQETKENAIEKATKEADVKYKTKESAGLDKSISETTSDRESVQAELDAIKEYLTKLEEMCVAKPDTYAERTKRRDSEIAGLKQALEILDGEAVLLQSAKRTLRGIRRH